MNGLLMPDAFPTAAYEYVHDRTRAAHPAAPNLERFIAAWNALAYRARASFDCAVAFRLAVAAHGSSPPPDERYGQERGLFDFYSNGFAALEATYFALFAIGSLRMPAAFPLTSAADEQKISPGRTVKAYENSSIDAQLSATLKAITEEACFKSFRETRNVLTHRTAPGRTMYVSVDPAETPPTEWKLDGRPVTPNLLNDDEAQLFSLLTKLVESAEDFVRGWS